MSSRMCCLYAYPGQSRARRATQAHEADHAWCGGAARRHLEAGEQPDEALRREVQEKLGIVPIDVVYVCTLLHRSQEFRKLHYFAVTRWQGAMQPHEAEAVLWIPLNAWTWMSIGWQWQSTCVSTHRERHQDGVGGSEPNETRWASSYATRPGRALYTHVLCTQMMLSLQHPWHGTSQCRSVPGWVCVRRMV